MSNETGCKVVSMKDIAIGNLEYGSGASAIEYDNKTRYVRITDIAESGKLNDKAVSPSIIENKYELKEGDLLFARSGATVGKTYLYNQTDGCCIYAGYLIRLVPNQKVIFPKYLYYFTKSSDYKLFVENNMRVVAQPNINAKQYGNLTIPLPPLEEQRRIADALDLASSLIEKRKKQIELLDTLAKSLFIEMFGDPVTNPMGWDICTINTVIDSLIAGWSINGEQRKLKEGEKAVLKVSAVTQGYFNENEYKVIDQKQKIKKYIYPQKGDLLFSRANTREMVGATCLIFKDYPDLILPDKLWKIRFVSSANMVYMKYVLSHQSIRNQLSNQSTGSSGSMYNVSMKKLKEIIIPLPPISLQTKFAEFVKSLENQKFLLQNGLEKLEMNYNALMQKYFL
ncbi:restriction endonuclease subunit S [Methanogenium marinum]|uniref:Restriction endonuclease subunit S n=1 Tax=Methanogenium marinum TaxID=348610 RepID=A0A9Q4KS12_9EURY|nr:restriction endonuclease subunit S [Methanogenium marinum]MDE4907133.1 restriction endonuclease subunit S [Methanogenium marinum]